jgi:hypothetical protein
MTRQKGLKGLGIWLVFRPRLERRVYHITVSMWMKYNLDLTKTQDDGYGELYEQT